MFSYPRLVLGVLVPRHGALDPFFEVNHWLPVELVLSLRAVEHAPARFTRTGGTVGWDEGGAELSLEQLEDLIHAGIDTCAHVVDTTPTLARSDIRRDHVVDDT